MSSLKDHTIANSSVRYSHFNS